MPRLLVLIFIAMVACQPALGAIIYDNAAGVLSAPSGDQGWTNTGFFDNADGGGVAIAPSYFLTAQHLGVGDSFFLNGTIYPLAAFYDIAGTDLRIGKITGTLPTYAQLYSGAAGTEVGKTISMVGWGHYAQGWGVVTNTVQNGWYWVGSQPTKNWASNTVTAVSAFGTSSHYLNYQFNPVANSGIYTSHDSGGGNFIFNNGAWQLAGITYGATAYYTHNVMANTYTPLYNPGDDSGAVVYNGTGLYIATAYDTNGNPIAYAPASGPEDGFATEIAPYVAQINAITGVPEPASAGLLMILSLGMLGRRRRSSTR